MRRNTVRLAQRVDRIAILVGDCLAVNLVGCAGIELELAGDRLGIRLGLR